MYGRKYHTQQKNNHAYHNDYNENNINTGNNMYSTGYSPMMMYPPAVMLPPLTGTGIIVGGQPSPSFQYSTPTPVNNAGYYDGYSFTQYSNMIPIGMPTLYRQQHPQQQVSDGHYQSGRGGNVMSRQASHSRKNSLSRNVHNDHNTYNNVDVNDESGDEDDDSENNGYDGSSDDDEGEKPPHPPNWFLNKSVFNVSKSTTSASRKTINDPRFDKIMTSNTKQTTARSIKKPSIAPSNSYTTTSFRSPQSHDPRRVKFDDIKMPGRLPVRESDAFIQARLKREREQEFSERVRQQLLSRAKSHARLQTSLGGSRLQSQYYNQYK